MKNPEIIEMLNKLLADELVAITLYMVSAEVVRSWGYEGLHPIITARARDEMKHAEKLIERIVALNEVPRLEHQAMEDFNPGSVQGIMERDLSGERAAVAQYNEAIAKAAQGNDGETRMLMESILHDEESHVAWIATQLELISQVGLERYLAARA